MAEDIIKQAKAALEKALEHWTPIYEKAQSDINFLSDDPSAQWDAADYAKRTRAKRPTLTIDQLNQFVNKVANDIRMNTPTINVVPNGGGADILTAAVYKGLIRDIETRSRADTAYDTASTSAIEGSIGFFRIDHDYRDDESFEQELKVQRVVNPLTIYIDEESIEPDGSDGRKGFALEEISKDAFTSRWPDNDPVSFVAEGLPALTNEEYLWILEYFYIEETPGLLCQLRDGTTQTVAEGTDPKTVGDVVNSRPIKTRKVHRCKLSGKDELEKTTFPGQYIPIIPVYGKEAWRNGKRELHSLHRKSHDGQRMFNYWKSTEVELLMKQPKAQVIAARGTIDAYADLYINPDGSQVLPYEAYDDQGRELPPPVIGNPPRIPEGVVMAARASVDDIKSTMGLYDAFLGQRSNETSGKAINARKMEGDRAVYHFGDNLLRSISHAGRILVGAIPEVYDTPRIISVVGMEDTAEILGINGAMVPGQKQSFDLRTGRYGVQVTTGSPFATMRQEAAEFFKQVVMTTPELMQVIGDLVFKYMDFPGAQAVSERLHNMLPPQALGTSGSDPQVQKLTAAVTQLQQHSQDLEKQLADKTAETQFKSQTEMSKIQTEKGKQQIEFTKMDLEREKVQQDADLKGAEINLKEQELDIKRQELGVRLVEAALASKEQPITEGELQWMDKIQQQEQTTLAT